MQPVCVSMSLGMRPPCCWPSVWGWLAGTVFLGVRGGLESGLPFLPAVRKQQMVSCHHTVSSAEAPISVSPAGLPALPAMERPQWRCCGFVGVTRRLSNDQATELFLFKGKVKGTGNLRARKGAACSIRTCRCVE